MQRLLIVVWWIIHQGLCNLFVVILLNLAPATLYAKTLCFHKTPLSLHSRSYSAVKCKIIATANECSAEIKTGRLSVYRIKNLKYCLFYCLFALKWLVVTFSLSPSTKLNLISNEMSIYVANKYSCRVIKMWRLSIKNHANESFRTYHAFCLNILFSIFISLHGSIISICHIGTSFQLTRFDS